MEFPTINNADTVAKYAAEIASRYRNGVNAGAPAPAPRRQRKRSLTKVCEAARRAGADRVIVDGAVIVLSPAATVPESDGNEFDEWMAKHAH
jgi:hypothetical protein